MSRQPHPTIDLGHVHSTFPLNAHTPSPQSDISLSSHDTLDCDDDDIYHTDIEHLLRRKKPWYRHPFGFIHGPSLHKDLSPKPLRESLALDTLKKQCVPSVPKILRVTLVALYLTLWFALFCSVQLPYWIHRPFLESDQQVPIRSIGCGDTIGWKGKNNACGLNGSLCEYPKGDIYVRCPALCDRESWVYSAMPVGLQNIKYRGYYIGGGRLGNDNSNRYDSLQISAPYRADSFVCGAAVHAGIVSPLTGGVARLTYDVPEQVSFPSASDRRVASRSIEFDSFFPRAFYFKSFNNANVSRAHDPRFRAVILNIVGGIPLVFLASAPVFYWIMNMVGFWTIILSLDPPVTPGSLVPGDFAQLLSIALERLLPTCFILHVMWQSSTTITLSPAPGKVASPWKRLLLWYPSFWVGVLNNLTFDRLPVDRLLPDDIRQQPGAVFCIWIILTSVAVGAAIQAYQVWRSGRLAKFAAFYAIVALGITLISQILGLSLRIHHYILAMILIPGCSTRGSPAHVFQGVLGGLLLSGTARWGLAAIAETVVSLKRQDPTGTLAPPQLAFDLASKTLLVVPSLPGMQNVSSTFSLLINDVERLVANSSEAIDFGNLFSQNLQLNQSIEHALQRVGGDVTLFIRAGWRTSAEYHDYSKAAVLKWPSGLFTAPEVGLT